MLSLRCRSTLSLFFAAILIAIIGCGGTGNSASNPSTPSNPSNPGGNPGGTGGGGGGAPQSSTFVYFNNGNPLKNIFAFKLGSDGTLTAMSGSPFPDPDIIFGQTSKFLVGANTNSSAFGPSVYSVNTQTGIPQGSVGHVNDGGGVTDGAVLYVSSISSNGTNGAGGGIDAYSISSTGQLSLVPGSPFDPSPSDVFFRNDYGPSQIVGSFLFASLNTVKDAGDVSVFSRAANGALTRKFGFGNGDSPFGFVIGPSARFAYVTSDVSNLDVYSLDLNADSATRIQQVQIHDQVAGGFAVLDSGGKFLFMRDNGLRVFSIDQSSGKLTEVAGSPFFANDNGIQSFRVDPSGRFLIVEHQNSVNVYSISAAGALAQVGPSYAVGDNLGGITFAIF